LTQSLIFESEDQVKSQGQVEGLRGWNTVSAENPCLVKVGNNFVGLFCGAIGGSGIYPSSYDIGLFYQTVPHNHKSQDDHEGWNHHTPDPPST